MNTEIPGIFSEVNLQNFLDDYENDLIYIREKISRLQFKKLVEKVVVPEINELEDIFAKKITNPEFEELILKWIDKVQNPILKRRLTLFQNIILKSKITHNRDVQRLTQKLSDIMITHQYNIEGVKSDLGKIRDILRKSKDSKLRQKAWMAKNALSKILENDMLTLIHLRNDLAQELGYKNYAEFALEIEGLSLSDVRELLNSLTNTSDLIYSKILRDGCNSLGLSQINPWDIMFLLENLGGINPKLFLKEKIIPLLKQWGKIHEINLDKLGIKIVFTDIPYNGLCMKLNDTEIIILSNPADGHTYFRTLFHELGHALHSAFNRQKYFSFRRDSGILGEAMAEIIGYTTHQTEWLQDMGFDIDICHEFQKKLIAPWFYYLRERTANALTEYLIYENSGKEPDIIRAEMDQKILGTTYDITPRWAADSWLINYPIYWQNYVLADIIASQIYSTLEVKYGGLYKKPQALEEIIKCYYEPGASIDWQEKIYNHTGCKLKVDDLVNDLKIYLD